MNYYRTHSMYDSIQIVYAASSPLPDNLRLSTPNYLMSDGQTNYESASLSGPALYPDGAVVKLGDLLAYGKAKADAPFAS